MPSIHYNSTVSSAICSLADGLVTDKRSMTPDLRYRLDHHHQAVIDIGGKPVFSLN